MADNLDWKSYNIPGMDSSRSIYGVGNDSFCAIVSECSLKEFNTVINERRGDDLIWLKQKAEEHMAILREAMIFSPLLPVKFCTLFNDLSGIESVLNDNAQIIKAFLNGYRGKEEWSCKAYVNTSVFREHIVNLVGSGITANTPGTAFLKRKQVQRSSAAKIERELAELVQNISQSISSSVLDVRTNKVLNRHITQKVDEMFLNMAILIDPSAKSELDTLVELHNQKFGSFGIRVELNGPWPLFNFCPKLN